MIELALVRDSRVKLRNAQGTSWVSSSSPHCGFSIREGGSNKGIEKSKQKHG